MCPVSKEAPEQEKIHSSTASPYISPNHRQDTRTIKRQRITNPEAVRDPTLRGTPEATYAGMTNAGSLKKVKKTFEEIKERATTLHDITKKYLKKNENSRI